jgi:hypothetical protein
MSNGDSLRAEIEKRFTLNWLIQGASQHVGMTLHHLIRDDLAAIHPKLPLWYDQMALINQLQWWRPLPTLLFGWPPRWWRRAARSPRHPFYNHPLLARYGGLMAEAFRCRALERARLKGVWRWPATFSVHTSILLGRIRQCERREPGPIIRAACRAASEAWGIEATRFRPQLLFSQGSIPPFAPVHHSFSLGSIALRSCACAWGGVSREADGSLCVRAAAVNGYYLTKELVKGTAELICLHGLGELDEETYSQVIRATDRIDVEPAMLQSGGEIWRRLLRVIPRTIRPAEVLMRLALAPNDLVVEVLSEVIEESASASDRVRSLCEAGL